MSTKLTPDNKAEITQKLNNIRQEIDKIKNILKNSSTTTLDKLPTPIMYIEKVL